MKYTHIYTYIGRKSIMSCFVLVESDLSPYFHPQNLSMSATEHKWGQFGPAVSHVPYHYPYYICWRVMNAFLFWKYILKSAPLTGYLGRPNLLLLWLMNSCVDLNKKCIFIRYFIYCMYLGLFIIYLSILYIKYIDTNKMQFGTQGLFFIFLMYAYSYLYKHKYTYMLCSRSSL